MYIRYSVDRGDLIGVPSNVQRVSENSTIEYSISLSLKPGASDADASVFINLEANMLKPPSHPTMTCTVSPSQIEFVGETNPKAIIVRVGSNQVDEGAR